MQFITISQMLGTQGDKVARKVADNLKYAFYGEEELFEAAEEMEVLSDVKKLDERAPSLLERLFSERPKVYLDRLQSVIYEVAKEGDAVFFGRGSQLLLNQFKCAFHVLIVGSKEKRIERLMKEMNLGREEAEKTIHRSDEEKRGFIQFAFGEDWLNFHLYDLILNTDKLSPDSAAKAITDAARSEEIKACGADAVQALGKLSLQRRIESVFLEEGIPSYPAFFSVEEPENVRLYGIVYSGEEKGRIENVVKKVKGVKKIENDITVFSRGVGGI
jgi:cytidylate kinase